MIEEFSYHSHEVGSSAFSQSVHPFRSSSNSHNNRCETSSLKQSTLQLCQQQAKKASSSLCILCRSSLPQKLTTAHQKPEKHSESFRKIAETTDLKDTNCIKSLQDECKNASVVSGKNIQTI